jgi:prophage endopeptidase
MLAVAWKYRAIVGAVACFGAGWFVNGALWESKYDRREAAWSAAMIDAIAQARDEEREIGRRVAVIDAAQTEKLRYAENEVDRLRRAVDDGGKRLRVKAACPAPVPGAASGPGLDTGTAAELTADARPDYFALVAGLEREAAKLTACQMILRAERP